jgi:hypothetical protein
MHYIFEGNCRDKELWEVLFNSLSRAVFLKEQLQYYTTNLGHVGEDFIEQFNQWHAEVSENLN